MMKKKLLYGITMLSFTIVGTVFAQHERPMGTPPFVTACNNLSAGDNCSFENRKGEKIAGSCTLHARPHSSEKELVCWNEFEMSKHKGKRTPRGQEPK